MSSIITFKNDSTKNDSTAESHAPFPEPWPDTDDDDTPHAEWKLERDGTGMRITHTGLFNQTYDQPELFKAVRTKITSSESLCKPPFVTSSRWTDGLNYLKTQSAGYVEQVEATGISVAGEKATGPIVAWKIHTSWSRPVLDTGAAAAFVEIKQEHVVQQCLPEEEDEGPDGEDGELYRDLVTESKEFKYCVPVT